VNVFFGICSIYSGVWFFTQRTHWVHAFMGVLFILSGALFILPSVIS
jgi:hypothetical protein